MKKEKPHNSEINDLLKQVLKDDLPPESEKRMRRQFIQFRKKIEQSGLKQRMNFSIIWRHFFRPKGWQWARWMLKKEVLALSSIIMVALGGFMHVSGHRSALAESVSMLSLSVSVSDQMRHTGSMECTAQVPWENGQSLAYSILWLSPNITRVDVQKTDEIHKTLWISDEDIKIADFDKNTLQKIESVEQIKDPIFQPIMGFISPIELAELMYGRWQPRQFEQKGERELGTFTFTIHEEKALLEMTVNLNTYLPMSIRKFLPGSTKAGKEEKLVMQMHFIWNQPVSPQLMIPKIIKRSQSA